MDMRTMHEYRELRRDCRMPRDMAREIAMTHAVLAYVNDRRVTR